MCLCLPESQRRRPVPAQWVNESGRVAHPNSPAGQGGPGAFRSPGVFGACTGDDLLPNADAPVARGVDPSLIALAEQEEEKKVLRQPPPKVANDAADELVQKVLTLKLKADKSGVSGLTGASTDFADVASGQIFKTPDAKGLVGSFTNSLAWVITIGTQYGTGKIDEDSAYGRGTTNDDIAAGNVTLGFHEGCHREALLAYFRSTSLPAFDGAVGDTIAAFEAKVTAHHEALRAYFDKARTDNVAAVDEVGDPTMSEYLNPPTP